MNAAVGTTGKGWRRNQAKPYVIKVSEESGAMYLEREHHPLLGELPYAMALVLTVLFALLSCCQYIQLQTSVELRIRQTEALERQLHTLRNDNTLAEKDVSYVQDLNYIYEVATGTLGMVSVAEGNILYYDRSDSEYVYQRDNIPFIGLK